MSAAMPPYRCCGGLEHIKTWADLTTDPNRPSKMVCAACRKTLIRVDHDAALDELDAVETHVSERGSRE